MASLNDRQQPIGGAANMHARQRSKVTNGKRLFADATVDGRGVWVRRMRDLISLHVNDLGGVDAISTAEHSICRRAATITTELELLEKKFAIANGADPASLDLYLRAANSLRRMLEAIGVKYDPSRARDVTKYPDIIKELDRRTIAEDIVE